MNYSYNIYKNGYKIADGTNLEGSREYARKMNANKIIRFSENATKKEFKI
jgi:hypothetical protein